MPFSGAGVYTPPAADFPVVTQTVISSTHYNNVINDIATGLSLCLTKDGQQTATANIPFGGFRATNVGITAIAGSVGTPAINVSDTGTGLYRSAASELAVTVAGTQRARFDGTGLIVTGVGTFSGATSTTTLTASTSVVTPLVQSAGAADLVIGPSGVGSLQLSSNGSNFWNINFSGTFTPNTDNATAFGQPSLRIRQVFTPIIDSGTTGSLSLRTNNGTTQAEISHTGGTIVNWFQLTGNITTGAPQLRASGSDTDIDAIVTSKGAGSISLRTNNSAVVGLTVLHTASSTRNITVTGSNGGNPTLSTTAGSLAITPSVVIAGGLSVSSGLANSVTLAGSATSPTISTTAGDLLLSPTGAASVVQFGYTNPALGGGATPTFGTIGGSGPVTAAQAYWLKLRDSTGTLFFVPGWH